MRSTRFEARGLGGFIFVGADQNMVTKRPQNWSPGLILGAFCTIFRARPVGTGLGAKFGRKPAKNQIQITICITYSKLVRVPAHIVADLAEQIKYLKNTENRSWRTLAGPNTSKIQKK